jgi:hypothetical protein
VALLLRTAKEIKDAETKLQATQKRLLACKQKKDHSGFVE